MSSISWNKIEDDRHPSVRNDKRGSKNVYHWTPTEHPFFLSSHEEETIIKRKKKKKKKDPYYLAKADLWTRGINDMHFKQSMSTILNIEAQNIISYQFIDEKNNHWLIALNSNTFDKNTLNDRLKSNFEWNKSRNHAKEDLLKAVCGSECFILLTNSLWGLAMDPIDKIHKLLEIFIFTMSFLNLGDFLNDYTFRTSLGLPNSKIQEQLDRLPAEAWYNTVMNKNLYFDLFSKSDGEIEQIKRNFDIEYSNELLQYLCIYHNDSCLHRIEDRKECLTNKISKNIINDKEIGGAEIMNRIETEDFTCVTMRVDNDKKIYNSLVGNELNNAYVIYNNKTPTIRTIEILDQAIDIWKKFNKNALKNKFKTKDRRIFSKILNFKIPGYHSDTTNNENLNSE